MWTGFSCGGSPDVHRTLLNLLNVTLLAFSPVVDPSRVPIISRWWDTTMPIWTLLASAVSILMMLPSIQASRTSVRNAELKTNNDYQLVVLMLLFPPSPCPLVFFVKSFALCLHVCLFFFFSLASHLTVSSPAPLLLSFTSFVHSPLFPLCLHVVVFHWCPTPLLSNHLLLDFPNLPTNSTFNSALPLHSLLFLLCWLCHFIASHSTPSIPAPPFSFFLSFFFPTIFSTIPPSTHHILDGPAVSLSLPSSFSSPLLPSFWVGLVLSLCPLFLLLLTHLFSRIFLVPHLSSPFLHPPSHLLPLSSRWAVLLLLFLPPLVILPPHLLSSTLPLVSTLLFLHPPSRLILGGPCITVFSVDPRAPCGPVGPSWHHGRWSGLVRPHWHYHLLWQAGWGEQKPIETSQTS